MIKIMKYFLILLYSTLLLLSFDKKSTYEDLNVTLGNLDIDFILQNKKGENLIDNANFPSSGFKLFGNFDGLKTLITKTKLEYSSWYNIEEIDGKKYLKTAFLQEKDKQFSVFYIEWNTNHTDKFIAYSENTNGTINLGNIWLNGDFVPADYNPNIGRIMTITK